MAADGMADRMAVGSRPAASPMPTCWTGPAGRRPRCGPAASSGSALVDVNSEAVPLLLFASALAGVPFAPLNYRLADDRLRAVVERVAPALVGGRRRAARARIAGASGGLELLARSELRRRLEPGRPCR